MDSKHHQELTPSLVAEVLVISDAAGFDALRNGMGVAACRRPHLGFPEFHLATLLVAAPGEEFTRRLLHLVTLREAGELIAIAPFYIEVHRHNSLASTRTLRFIGTILSDHLDMIVRPGREEAAIAPSPGIWPCSGNQSTPSIWSRFPMNPRCAGNWVPHSPLPACPPPWKSATAARG